MNERKRGIGRVALYASVIGAMAVSLIPASASSVAAQGQTRKINNFDVAGRFLEVWSKQGSEQNNVYVNGLPITARRPEISLTDGKTYEMQWFERARFEAHPEKQAPYDVELGLLGVSKVEGRGSVDPATKRVRNPADAAFVGIDKPADTSATKVWFQETRHSVTGKILEYWNKYGGLQQFGFPLSEQFQEISEADGKTYTVQYFERNRFELHPEKAAPYEVELGLLGVEQYKTTPVALASNPNQPQPNTRSSKDTAVIAMSQEPPNLTFVESLAVASTVVTMLDRGLIEQDQNSNFYPSIAYYVPTLENGGSYYVGVGADRHLVTKYKLRRGIKWSDGQEVDSNDAVFAYEYVMRPDTPVPSRATLQKLANVDNPDKYTVVYNWMSLNQGKEFIGKVPNKEDYSFIDEFVKANKPIVDPAYYAIGGILPQHVLNSIPGPRLKESAYGREGYVGTGPFKVEKWTKGQEMVLVRNPNYTLGAPAILSRIVIRFIADTNQILAQLRTGDIDMATGDAFAGPSDALNQLDKNTLRVNSVPASIWEHIDFNLDHPPFKDRAVREAIITGINRQRIVDVAYLGQTKVLNGVVPPVAWYSLENPDYVKTYNPKAKLPIYNYDVAKANQILDQAGWARGGDGIRAKGGEKLQFELATTAGNANRERSTQLVQADLRAIGVDAQLKYYPASQYFGEGGIIDRAVCKMCLFAWLQDPLLGDFDLWSSSQIPSPADPSGQNNTRYRNPKLDSLNDQFKGDIDRNKVAEFAAEAQALLMQDIVTVPLYARSNLEVSRTSLQNHKTTNSLVSPSWNIEQWFFR